jgi:hypothetical protein
MPGIQSQRRRLGYAEIAIDAASFVSFQHGVAHILIKRSEACDKLKPSRINKILQQLPEFMKNRRNAGDKLMDRNLARRFFEKNSCFLP